MTCYVKNYNNYLVWKKICILFSKFGYFRFFHIELFFERRPIQSNIGHDHRAILTSMCNGFTFLSRTMPLCIIYLKTDNFVHKLMYAN